MYIIISSKSAPLYHGTTWKNAVNIIESNELRANISNETETYGVSFTRNMDSAYDQVSLVIDQERLSYNYKIDPVYRDGISGLDLAEERVPRTIKNIRNYILYLKFNNPVYLKYIRRIIVEHFDEDDLLEKERFSNRKLNMVHSCYQVLQVAHKYNIEVDKLFKEVEAYIDMYIDRKFDYEYKHILDIRKKVL